MKFLLDSPSYVSCVRGMDWRINAVPGEFSLTGALWDQNGEKAEEAVPGSCCSLEILPPADVPENGSLLFLLHWDFFQEKQPGELFSISGGRWNWNWPLLEIQMPFRSLILKNLPIPEQPGRRFFEVYYRSPGDEFFRLPEISFMVANLKAESLQVRLSSNFSGRKLRFSVVAEQGAPQYFMADVNCREKVTLEYGGQRRDIRLVNGVAAGSLPLASGVGPFFIKAFNINLGCGESNLVDPGFAADSGLNLYWGDMHVHSGESDGMGEPEDVLARARDWQRLDFMAFNEHIENSLCWRIWTRNKWKKLQRLYDGATHDGEFVVVPGFEFRSYCNLWCFSDEYLDYLGPEINLDEKNILVSVKNAKWHEQELGHQRQIAEFAAKPDWLVGYHRLEALKDQLGYLPVPVQLLQIAHYKRPPEIGSLDFLKRGDRVAFFGSTDTHLGLPGIGFRKGRNAPSGLTAVYAAELSRKGLHEALKNRCTYATMGSRTLLDVRLNHHPMGSEFSLEGEDRLELAVRAAGRERLNSMDIVLNGDTVAIVELEGKKQFDYVWHGLKKGTGTDFIFIRLHLEDGRMVWNSPIWFR